MTGEGADAVEEPKVKEILSDTSDDIAPALAEDFVKEGGGGGDDNGDEGEGEDGEEPRGRCNRSEKKGRKAVQKLGMRQLTGITKVTIRRSRNIFFVIHKPTVFKYPQSETYVVFGEAKIEDLNLKATTEAAAQFTNMPEEVRAAAARSSAPSQPAAAKIKEVTEEDVPISDVGLEQSDIELVMSQTGCPREKAIEKLRQNPDVVDAILDLH